MAILDSNIVPINWIRESSQYALIPGHQKQKTVRRVKSLYRAKGNCFFSRGISRELIDFIYRAVTRLGLREKKLLFSRGAVKNKNRTLLNAVGITELDWDVGISIRIPLKLKYNQTVQITFDGREHILRLMELIVLSALLHLAYPAKPGAWCQEMSAAIITGGWTRLKGKPGNVLAK